MDPLQFEAMSRRVGSAPSRRAALAAMVAAVAAGVPRFGQDEVEAGIPILNCKPVGKSCDTDKKCCTGRCRRGHCGCSKKGRPCWAPFEGAMCCSQKCSSGKCT